MGPRLLLRHQWTAGPAIGQGRKTAYPKMQQMQSGGGTSLCHAAADVQCTLGSLAVSLARDWLWASVRTDATPGHFNFYFGCLAILCGRRTPCVAELPLGTPLDGHSVVNLCPAVSVRCACRAFGSLCGLAAPDSRATTMPRRRNPCPTTTWARLAVFAAAGVRWMFRIGYVPNRQGGWWKSPKTRPICAPRVAQTDATCDENPLLRCKNVGTTTGR